MDGHLETPHLLSYKKLHLIIFMFNNGKIINFKMQNIYKDNRSFKKAMKELHGKNIVLINQQKKGNEYKLTLQGEHLGGILNELTK